MKRLPLVLWVIGWPLSQQFQDQWYEASHHVSDETKGLACLIDLVIWVLMWIYLARKADKDA